MNKKSKRSSSLSGLESKLDELRKEISAAHGSMLPHTVLSTQQIGLISSQKPDSLQEVELSFLIVTRIFFGLCICNPLC